MLNALRIGHFGHGASGKSLGHRPPLPHPSLSQPRSVRSILSSTLCGAQCYKNNNKVLDPSQLADMTQLPYPKTGRSLCKTSVSSGNDRPRYPDPPMEMAADSASSLDSAASSTGGKDSRSGKGQRRSPFSKLIKLVSPIKGLPGLLSNRKVAANKESSVDKPTKESTQVSGLNSDDGVEDDDISVLELPVGVSSCSNNSSHGRNHSSKEPTIHSPALTAMEAAGDLGSSSTASSGPGSESKNSSQVSEAGVASINSKECKVEPDLPGMVSSTPTGVSSSHAPRPLAPLQGPLPSVSSRADAKPSSVQSAKRKTPLYRMKMLLDLKKVRESSEEGEKLPRIPTLKEWVRQEKRKEKEERKAAKKAMKIKEKQLKKELKQEQKATGIVNETKEKGPAKSEVNRDPLPPKKGASKVQVAPKKVQKEQSIADVKKESQPKLAWGEVKEEPPQSNGPQPQLRKESGQAVKVPQTNKSLEEPKISSAMRSSNRTNEKGRLQRPLGAHPRRRRSTLISIQETSPHHYSRPDSDSRSDPSSDELEKEQRVNTRVRPLAAHHSRRRRTMESRMQVSPSSAGRPTGEITKNNDDIIITENLKPRSQEPAPASGQKCEPLPPCQRKLAWTH